MHFYLLYTFTSFACRRSANKNAPTLRLGHWFVELEGLILFPIWVNLTNNALCIRKGYIIIFFTHIQALLASA